MAKLDQGILGPFRGKVGTVVGYLWRGKPVVRAYRKKINYPNTERQQAERDWFVSMVRFAATARQALLLGLREKAARDVMTEGNAFVKMNKDCFGRDAACRVRSAAAEDMSRSAADMVSYGSTADAARRVRTGVDYARIKISEGAAADMVSYGLTADAARRVRTGVDYARIKISEGSAADMVSYGLTADAARRVRTGVDYERIRIAEGAAAAVRFTTARMDERGVLRIDFEKNSGMSRAKASDNVYVYVYNIDTREGLLSAAAPRRRGHLEMRLPDGWNDLNIKTWGFVVDSEGRASASQYVAMAEPVASEVPEVPGVENTDGAFNEAGTLRQAIKREPLAGYCRDDGGGGDVLDY